jgi:NTE family protein
VGTSTAKPISLALQGGGAHGAFTWGVLDALLEDGRLSIEAISGTSAGAMNAICVADGLLRDGPDGAREALARFWRAISTNGGLSVSERQAFDRLWGAWTVPFFHLNPVVDFLSRYGNPYALNPLNVNPLKDVLERVIDFERVRTCTERIRLFVSATDVRAGRIAVFREDELTADHVMASAALPKIFQAVEIGGRCYWDGGYMGNPALFPLFYDVRTSDVLLVQLNAVERGATPRTADEIAAREAEITFNAPLLAEIRAIAFVSRLVDEGLLPAERYKRVLMHALRMKDAFDDLGAGTKLNTDWDFFVLLRDAGRRAMQAWLKRHIDAVGQKATVDLRRLLGDDPLKARRAARPVSA